MHSFECLCNGNTDTLVSVFYSCVALLILFLFTIRLILCYLLAGKSGRPADVSIGYDGIYDC